MKLRDKMKDEKYFDDYIKLVIEVVQSNENQIKTNRIPAANVENSKRSSRILSLTLLISKYSAGYDLALIADDYVDLVKEITGMFLNDYGDVLSLIAMGVMFDFPENTRESLNNIVSDKYKNDFLSNFFLGNKDSDYSVRQPQEYQNIVDIIKKCTKENIAEFIKVYLDKTWYKDMRGFGWHDNHKSKHDVYFGYWSFESGAVMKIFGADDSGLKDTTHYPYDMVHYKES